MSIALQLENLSKTYSGKEVVNRINLEVRQGEIFGLLGPNGAGKSTTINMITGVTGISSGKVRVFGHDNQSDFITTRRLTGVMHQEIVVDTFFHIDRALQLHSGYYGVPDDPKWRNLLIERLALGPHLKKSMNKLSGGMKRRFMVAKALIHKPKLLILDEPTAGVDVELRQSLWGFVREINEREGTTVLLTTHYLEEAEEMCERVAIMNEGSLIAMDRTEDILNKMEEKRLVVHFAEGLGSLPPSLSLFDCKLQEGGSSVSFRLSPKMDLSHLLQELAKQDLKVKEIETRSPSLQEAFLKLTQKGRL